MAFSSNTSRGGLRRFLARAAEEDYIYYLMEAFDQKWKRETEGAVGAYWGVYDVERKAKFQFTDPIVQIPGWPILAAISVIIALITFALTLIDSKHLGARGRGFLALITYAAATAAVWIIYDYTHQYLTFTSVAVGILLSLGMVGVIVVLLAEAHEWAEALWTQQQRRPFKPVEVSEDALPMVSVHVPAYNEPPDMMIETLDALAQLDYPRYEVIVIDNNTRDPAVWQPVRDHCAKLGGEGSSKELTYVPKDVRARKAKEQARKAAAAEERRDKRKRRNVKDLGFKTPFKNKM